MTNKNESVRMIFLNSFRRLRIQDSSYNLNEMTSDYHSVCPISEEEVATQYNPIA
jgi:hypothetical protein